MSRKKKSAQQHPYEKLQLPENAPFVLQPSPGRDWGAFASRDISRGEVILREEAMFTVTGNPIKASDIMSRFRGLCPEAKQQVNLVQNSAPDEVQSSLMTFDKHNFTISKPPKPTVRGFFLLLSRFNHSCGPNSASHEAHNHGDCLTLIATKDIKQGEEITKIYVPVEGLTRTERHIELGFTCKCQVCELPAAELALSDHRRTIIRALWYAMLGQDFYIRCNKQTARFQDITKVFSAALLVQIHVCAVPVANLFIFSIFQIVLLELEGLRDDILIDNDLVRQNVHPLSQMFQTESNILTVKRAMKQDTWWKKLCVAFTLLDAKDAVDDRLGSLKAQNPTFTQEDLMQVVKLSPHNNPSAVFVI